MIKALSVESAGLYILLSLQLTSVLALQVNCLLALITVWAQIEPTL